MNVSIEDSIFIFIRKMTQGLKSCEKEYREIWGHGKDTVGMTVNSVVFKTDALGG